MVMTVKGVVIDTVHWFGKKLGFKPEKSQMGPDAQEFYCHIQVEYFVFY